MLTDGRGRSELMKNYCVICDEAGGDIHPIVNFFVKGRTARLLI